MGMMWMHSLFMLWTTCFTYTNVLKYVNKNIGE